MAMKQDPKAMQHLMMSAPVRDRQDLYDRYVPLVEFLGQAIGPNCEIVLHDLTVPDESIIAIVNGHISGRKLGGPVTNFALWFMRQGAKSSVPYVAGYRAVNGAGRICRSSSYFIRNEQNELIGMICVNVDITDFVQFHRFVGPQIGQSTPVVANGYEDEVEMLPMPDPIEDQPVDLGGFQDLSPVDEVKKQAVMDFTTPSAPKTVAEDTMENLQSNLDNLLESMLGGAIAKYGYVIEKMGVDERLNVVSDLDEAGFYLLKGGIAATAAKLGVSEATIYRYLVRVRQ